MRAGSRSGLGRFGLAPLAMQLVGMFALADASASLAATTWTVVNCSNAYYGAGEGGTLRSARRLRLFVLGSRSVEAVGEDPVVFAAQFERKVVGRRRPAADDVGADAQPVRGEVLVADPRLQVGRKRRAR